MEEGLAPLVENKRGCPFSCDFCGESSRYYNKVAVHSLNYLQKEYEYLAKKMTFLKNHPFPGFVFFSDSNTGMYDSDLNLCKFLRRLQEEYGWPKTIGTSTGKNSKERVMKCVKLLNGALTLTASVQSTDPEVLSSINRKNISTEELLSLAHQNGGRSFSEIILGLPHDSYEKHLKSIKDMMDALINELRIVQLMILPNTPMANFEYKKRFQLDTRWRLLCKGFERVQVVGGYKVAIEYEEICVGTENLTFGDYIQCRIAGLLVSVFYNNIFSVKTMDLFKENNMSIFDAYFYPLIDIKKPKGIRFAIDQYKEELGSELFNSKEGIERFLEQKDVYENLGNGKIGKNLVYYYSEQIRKHTQEILLMVEQVIEEIEPPELKENIKRDVYFLVHPQK